VSMDLAAQEAWLAANTFTCQRLAARITPQACAAYRQEHRGHTYQTPNSTVYHEGPRLLRWLHGV
jgi:hypothetical protein